MRAGTRAVSAVPEAFCKKKKGGFHFQRRTWRPRALNCLFTVKTNSNTKDSLFLKKKSSKNRRVALSDCDTSNESYSTLKRTSLFSQGQVKAREVLSPREVSAYSLCSFLMYG